MPKVCIKVFDPVLILNTVVNIENLSMNTLYRTKTDPRI